MNHKFTEAWPTWWTTRPSDVFVKAAEEMRIRPVVKFAPNPPPTTLEWVCSVCQVNKANLFTAFCSDHAPTIGSLRTNDPLRPDGCLRACTYPNGAHILECALQSYRRESRTDKAVPACGFRDEDGDACGQPLHHAGAHGPRLLREMAQRNSARPDYVKIARAWCDEHGVEGSWLEATLLAMLHDAYNAGCRSPRPDSAEKDWRDLAAAAYTAWVNDEGLLDAMRAISAAILKAPPRAETPLQVAATETIGAMQAQLNGYHDEIQHLRGVITKLRDLATWDEEEHDDEEPGEEDMSEALSEIYKAATVELCSWSRGGEAQVKP